MEKKIDKILPRLYELAKNSSGKNRDLFKELKRKSSQEVDKLFHFYHEDVFSEINCLDCANCCKSISPIITDKDIERISRKQKLKPSEIVERYLMIDEDEDYVFRQSPCPFLLPDNYCSIYEERPKACREYPHTDRKKMSQLFNLTLKNSKICPAVYLILEKIRKDW